MIKANVAFICVAFLLGFTGLLAGCESPGNPPETPPAAESSPSVEALVMPDEQAQDPTDDGDENQQNPTDNNNNIDMEMKTLDSILAYLESETFAPPTGFDKNNDDTLYGELTEVEYYSETTGTTRKCYVYTPPDYNAETTYPVLYLLHGIGGTHREWLNGAPNEILSNLIASGEVPPMIAVMPNVRAKEDDSASGDMFSVENIAAFDNFINDLRDDLMPYISENYPVSGRREYCAIAGLSMGGREALYIGISMPETFGYIGAFSPAPGLLSFANMGYPGQLSADEMTLPDEYKDNTFILINNGNQDGVVNDIPLTYHQALTENGIRHAYYTIDGGHDFKVWKNGLYYFAKCIFRIVL